MGLTYIGLVFALGRLFDAFTDPMIAGLSDKSHSKFGRRRKFLAISVLPFSLLSVLAFIPPVQGSSVLEYRLAILNRHYLLLVYDNVCDALFCMAFGTRP